MKDNDLFEVCEARGFPGLTVSNYMYKPGRRFIRREWKWGDDALAGAVKAGRCKLISEINEEVAVEEKAPKAKAPKAKVADSENGNEASE